MQRRPTTQDISWLLDLNRNNQLDVNPPYQRKSVWTTGDRRFFLDTIFRNYPSPAIFLHKTISDSGKTTYHVVDGKQRIETILRFVEGKIRVGSDYGDIRLDGRRWGDLGADSDLRRLFWNYQLTVELIDFEDTNIVNQVFDRLNRNARRLTAQELRHAKFDGWFAREAEREAQIEDWKDLGVATTARSKRMADIQFISELMLVVLEPRVHGFDQDALDNTYAKYDDEEDVGLSADIDTFRTKVDACRKFLVSINKVNGVVSEASRALGHIYTLWCYLVLADVLPDVKQFAEQYLVFLNKVGELSTEDGLNDLVSKDAATYGNAYAYLRALRGANTDTGPRQERLVALSGEMNAK